MKTFLKILLGLAIVIVILLVVGWFYIDSIAKAAIEHGSTNAMGVDTRVNSVSLSLLNGEVRIKGLTVANPEGFKTSHLMKTSRFDVTVDLASLLTNTIKVTHFEIDGLDMNIEQKLGSTATNVSSILDHMKSSSKEPAAAQPSSGKKIVVDKIIIRNVVAHVQVLPFSGEASTLNVPVPEIILENVTSDNASGVAVSQLVQRLFPAIMAAVIDKGKGIIPDANLKNLSTDVASATQALGTGTAQLLNQVGGDAAKSLEGLGGALDNTGKAVQKGMGDIFGGKKK